MRRHAGPSQCEYGRRHNNKYNMVEREGSPHRAKAFGAMKHNEKLSQPHTHSGQAKQGLRRANFNSSEEPQRLAQVQDVHLRNWKFHTNQHIDKGLEQGRPQLRLPSSSGSKSWHRKIEERADEAGPAKCSPQGVNSNVRVAQVRQLPRDQRFVLLFMMEAGPTPFVRRGG